MNRWMLYAVLLLVLCVDWENFSSARMWYWGSRYCYGMAGFVGGMGLNFEKKYNKEMEYSRG